MWDDTWSEFSALYLQGGGVFMQFKLTRFASKCIEFPNITSTSYDFLYFECSNFLYSTLLSKIVEEQ